MLAGYCDGGCNNKTHTNAYGSFLVHDDNNEIVVHKKLHYSNVRTSNEAEYETFIALLIWLLENDYSKGVSNHSKITIYSDSKLMVNQIKGVWSISAENLVERCDVAKLLLEQLGNINLVWVRREHIVKVLGH